MNMNAFYDFLLQFTTIYLPIGSLLGGLIYFYLSPVMTNMTMKKWCKKMGMIFFGVAFVSFMWFPCVMVFWIATL